MSKIGYIEYYILFLFLADKDTNKSYNKTWCQNSCKLNNFNLVFETKTILKFTKNTKSI